MRRRLTEVLERRKEMMIAALWANSGFEGQQGADARRSAIEELEEHYDTAVRSILAREVQDEEIDKDNPFFAAAERGLQKVAPVKKSEGTVSEVVEETEDPFPELDIDQ